MEEVVRIFSNQLHGEWLQLTKGRVGQEARGFTIPDSTLLGEMQKEIQQNLLASTCPTQDDQATAASIVVSSSTRYSNSTRRATGMP